MSNSKRPPNELESRLHKAAITDPKNILTLDHAQSLVPDGKARVDAFNWLLSVGLFKPLHNERGRLVAFRAVTKGEVTAAQNLTSDEKLVLDHIAGARNEGIWTKSLKAKTNLHQNVVDRCLKSLVQKKLIKRIPAINNKKIYMLEGLEPSAELTGGAWYIDGELDTGLIHHLTEACLKIIQEMSFPKRHSGKDGSVYPISNSPKYPDVHDILKFIKRANITQVELTVSEIESLLNVLVLDGEIEKLPATGSMLWDIDDIPDGEDNETSQRSTKKRRKHASHDDGAKASKKKRKKKYSSSEESSADDDEETTKRPKRKRPKTTTSKQSRRDKPTSLFAEDSSSSDEETRFREHKKKTKRERLSSEDDGDSSSVTESGSETNRRANKPKAMKRLPSPVRTLTFDDIDDGRNHVYRAVKHERIPLGWIEAPCTLCPSFDFCKEGGPVNPRSCGYYRDWLSEGGVEAIEDGV